MKSILSRGRIAAEKRMTERCTVTRDGDEKDPLTGIAQRETVVVSMCRVVQVTGAERTRLSIEQVVTLQQREIHFPISTTPLRVGDIAQITNSTVAPHLVGALLRVTGISSGSQVTAARYVVEER